MKTHAFIFARGGSQGLKRKNLKKIKDSSLLEIALKKAKKIKKIDQIFISTEDLEIADIALQNEVNVIKRPKKLASNKSPEILSWKHAIEYVEKNFGPFEIFTSIPCTSPFSRVEDINLSIKKIKRIKADFCVGITESNKSPHFNMVKINKTGFVDLYSANKKNIFRRQDAPKIFDLTTNFYTGKKDYILTCNTFFEGKVTFVKVDKKYALDIDDEFDYKIAKFLAENGINMTY
jgi:N-acylneuraminate cytidylyltransferase|tara:strand:+ start:553 stop:1254 length:702 start_codon:yes stop_codon:yes gene_type:complete